MFISIDFLTDHVIKYYLFMYIQSINRFSKVGKVIEMCKKNFRWYCVVVRPDVSCTMSITSLYMALIHHDVANSIFRKNVSSLCDLCAAVSERVQACAWRLSPCASLSSPFNFVFGLIRNDLKDIFKTLVLFLKMAVKAKHVEL